MRSSALSLVLAGATMSMAQSNSTSGLTIPATNGSLPVAGANGCAAGFYPGRDETIVTIPYTYQQVLSIIGNYTNLTWSGSPDNSVTTNASASTLQNDNWQAGDARIYDLDGAHLIETLTVYMKDPANQHYTEVHTLAPIRLEVQGVTLTSYASFDGQDWTPTCGGKAMVGNFTTVFCADDQSIAGPLYHQVHMTDALTIAKFLGGNNFTSCDSLGGTNGTGNGTTTSGTPTGPTSTPSTVTGEAAGSMTNSLRGALILTSIAGFAFLALA